MKYEIYKDDGDLWRWRFISANGNIIAVSSESYHNREDCLSSINILRYCANAPVVDSAE
ncbi:MAG: DUF1508 domain-containing protein [Acidobacteriota bacterium]|nr:DUF1508 domain-containing protein [Acidobacteriota bacterium]